MFDKINQLLKPLGNVRRAYIFFLAFAVTAVMMGGTYDRSHAETAQVFVTADAEEAAFDETVFDQTEYAFDYDYLDIDGSDILYAAAKSAKAKELTAVTADLGETESDAKTDNESADTESGSDAAVKKKASKEEQEAVTGDLGETKKAKKKKSSEAAAGFVYSEHIPISQELQEYTYEKCAERGVEYELVLAIMWRESRFTVDAVNVNTNGTRDSGLMQINDVNKKWLRERHGIVDLMDPYQNIDAGTTMLGDLTAKYGVHNAMMAYQYGEGGMARKIKQGQTTSKAIELAYAQRDYYRQLVKAA